MVFQHYGLWPHMDALDTVAYPLRRAGAGPLEPREHGRPSCSSRCASATSPGAARRSSRAVSSSAWAWRGRWRGVRRVYLLDEPTAHLDTVLKADLQAELATRMHADGAAAIHATHDVEEALAVADRVVLLRDGRGRAGRPPARCLRPARPTTGRRG